MQGRLSGKIKTLPQVYRFKALSFACFHSPTYQLVLDGKVVLLKGYASFL